MSLEEKIADYLVRNEIIGSGIQHSVARGILSLIRSSKSEEYDGEYSGMDAESNCTCVCHKKTNSEEWRKENEPYCRLCNGSGTICRKLSNKELLEFCKSGLYHIQNGQPFSWILPSGERIVKGEK